MLVDYDGNYLHAEIANAITHGLGFILALVFSLQMMQQVYRGVYVPAFPGGFSEYTVQFTLIVYCSSLNLCYIASTLLHSLFYFTGGVVGKVLRIMDHAGIYCLIIGNTCPILSLTADTPELKR